MRSMVVFFALLAVAVSSATPLAFNVSSSGTISVGGIASYTLANTLEADGGQTAFYVVVSSSANCVIQATISNSASSVDPFAINSTFPGDYSVYTFMPYPTFGATLNWTISLQGMESSCSYSVVARNIPALPISFGQTFTYENTDPWGYVRFTTLAKDANKPFTAFMAAIGVTTFGSQEITGCVVETGSDPSLGRNQEDWYVGDGMIGRSGQWGLYDDAPNFVEVVSGFFPSASVPLSFYARAQFNGSVPCPKWNVTLTSLPPTPLKVGEGAITLSSIATDPFSPAIIFGPTGASSYSLVLQYVSGMYCTVGWAGNDPATFSGDGSFQALGGVLLNATSPTSTVPVSGSSAPTFIWTAYLSPESENCVVTASFA